MPAESKQQNSYDQELSMEDNEVKQKARKQFFIFFPIGLVLLLIEYFLMTNYNLKPDASDTTIMLVFAPGLFGFLFLLGSIVGLLDTRRAKEVTMGEIISVVPLKEENPSKAKGINARSYKCHFIYSVNGQEYKGYESVLAPMREPERVYDYMNAKIKGYYSPKKPQNHWPVIPPLDQLELHTESS